jgi:hypothetical protein
MRLSLTSELPAKPTLQILPDDRLYSYKFLLNLFKTMNILNKVEDIEASSDKSSPIEEIYSITHLSKIAAWVEVEPDTDPCQCAIKKIMHFMAHFEAEQPLGAL